MPLPVRAYDRPLHPEVERLVYQINVIKMDAEGLVNGLGDAQFNWSPGPGSWSIAQCFDHLNKTNRLYLEEFEAAIPRAREEKVLSDGPFAYGLISRLMLRSVEPPVKMRFEAPKAFRPALRHTVDETVPEFMAVHDRVIEAMAQSSGLDLVRVKVATPIGRRIRFSLGVAFWILAGHDRRHLWQARQLRNTPGFPK